MASRRKPYFRFYPSDFMGGIRGLTAQEVGLYTMLLCRMYEEDGPIQDDPFRLATYCGMREKTFVAALEKLIRLGKITRANGALSNDRAMREISNRADDVEAASRAGKISAEKRQGNQGGEATPVERPFNHTDTDTDTDTKEPIGSLGRKPRRKPEVDLPEGWVPSERNIADAIERDFTDQEIDLEAERFRNHHHAKGSRFRDWDAAWRTWLANARRFAPKPSAADASARQIAFAARASRSPRDDCF